MTDPAKIETRNQLLKKGRTKGFWKIIDPSGNYEEVSSLTEYCRKREIPRHKLHTISLLPNGTDGHWKVIKVLFDQDKGIVETDSLKKQRLEAEYRRRVRDKRIVNWKILSPNGEVIDVDNLKNFCDTNGLSETELYNSYRYNNTSRNGWTVRKLSR